ncbi:unnamed protein product, partial [marine sediment metagenome]
MPVPSNLETNPPASNLRSSEPALSVAEGATPEGGEAQSVTHLCPTCPS